MILRNVPREEWPSLQLKCTAHDVLKGQRPDWGMRRKWEGNYLAMVRVILSYISLPEHILS